MTSLTKSDLCIPKINANISKNTIIENLLKTNIGTIDRITELPLKNNPLCKRILFTITWNLLNPKVALLRQRIQNNQTLKLIPKIDEPQFWLIALSCCPGKS